MMGELTKAENRQHCQTIILPPRQLQERVEAVLKSFLHVKDASGLRLFMSRMLTGWKLQWTHIQPGCLSDTVLNGDLRHFTDSLENPIFPMFSVHHERKRSAIKQNSTFGHLLEVPHS